jgi:hypothetical protein
VNRLDELEQRLERLENISDNNIHIITYNPEVMTETEAIDEYKKEHQIERFSYPPFCIQILNDDNIRNRSTT